MPLVLLYFIISTIIGLAVTMIDSKYVVKESFINTKQYNTRKTILWLLSYVPVINGLLLIAYLARMLVYMIQQEVDDEF